MTVRIPRGYIIALAALVLIGCIAVLAVMQADAEHKIRRLDSRIASLEIKPVPSLRFTYARALHRQGSVVSPNEHTTAFTATCPDGTALIGGGWNTVGGFVSILESAPDVGAWGVGAAAFDANVRTTIKPFGICVAGDGIMIDPPSPNSAVP